MDENNNYPDTVDSRSVDIIETIINQEEYDIPQKAIDAIKKQMSECKSKDIAQKFLDAFALKWKSRHARAIAKEREAARNSDKKD